MIIENIILTDFRVFQGRNEFDLYPRKKYGHKRPIILFGGLNGAGKTSILMAIRLALYGKQSLGATVAQSTYNNYLKDLIHTSRDSLIQPDSACVELTFTHAHLGELSRYKVKRNWNTQGSQIKEVLSISKNGEELNSLSYEHCQGFLNELIPIGVSDLFFFDGEKIGSLAEDESGCELGESIKKLIGLDLIEILRSDLGVLLRNSQKKHSSKELKAEIKSLENELETKEKQADKALEKYGYAKQEIIHVDQEINHIEQDISARGGAWANSRQTEKDLESELRGQKELIEIEMRELLGSSLPFCIAKSYTAQTVSVLEQESLFKAENITAKIVKKHLNSAAKKLKKNNFNQVEEITTLLNKEFSLILNPKQQIEIIHDISESDFRQIRTTLKNANDNIQDKFNSLSEKLTSHNNKLDEVGANIARAPEETVLKNLLDKLRKAQSKRQKAVTALTLQAKNYRELLRECMDIARKLTKASEQSVTSSNQSRSHKYAQNTITILHEFSEALAKSKTSDLEKEFAKSFAQLARKDDLRLQARIDPKKFSVSLVDPDGREIKKCNLSAGEKQIYAIAILEALAHTSGRKLPIIIDTPLGRLDSKHRKNIVENYLPNASQQVIILSTDTEVDESYYATLSKHISHAYHLSYASSSGSTSAEEGYFWKQLLNQDYVTTGTCEAV